MVINVLDLLLYMKISTHENTKLKDKIPFVYKGRFTILLIIVAIALFFWGNYIYPLCSDDYAYSYSFFTGMRLLSLCDILDSQIVHWNTWGGRFFAHSIAQAFLIFDKVWFNIANTILYAICTMIISVYAKKQFSTYSWLIVLLSFWVVMPYPGSAIFWLTGSCNYLWSTCLCVAYASLLFADSLKLRIYSFILAIPAGNSHEGIAFGLLSGIFIYALLTQEKKLQFYVSSLLFFIGFLSNCLAPGNFIRLAGQNHTESISLLAFAKSLPGEFLHLLIHGSDFGVRFCCVAFIISFGFSVLYIIFKFKCWRQCRIISFTVSAAASFVLCTYVNALFPRALFGFCFFSYTAILGIIDSIEKTYLRKCVNYIIMTLVLFVNLLEIPKMVTSVSAFSEFISKVSKDAINNNIIEATPAWLKIKQSRYVERYGMGENCLDNSSFERYHKTVPFSVVSQEIFTSIQENREAFASCLAGQQICLKTNSYIYYCIGPRPRKVVRLAKIDGNIRRYQCPVICIHRQYFALCQNNDIALEISFVDDSKVEIELDN